MSSLPEARKSIFEIQPYVPGKSAVATDKPVIKLSSNENAYGPSPKAVAAYQAAVSKLNRYPDGTASVFKQALAEVLGFTAERVVAGAGSDEIIHLLIQAYAGEGDEILYSEHGFLMYPIYARACGAVPVAVKEKNLTADVDALLQAVTPRTKLLFLANPNNPTGSYLPVYEVRRLREKLPSHIVLVLDAAYCEYVTAVDYNDGSELVNTTPNTVMLRTLSKIYGIPALRLGYGYMPEAMADVLNRIRGPFNVSSAAMEAGAAAIRDQDYIRHAVAQNTAGRERMTKALSALGLHVYPSQANFILVCFPAKGKCNASRANQFLLSQGIIVREVGNYGLPECLRITIGKEAENTAVIRTLTECIGRQ